MGELGQGLVLSGLGILITFFSLGALIGLILLLNWLFPSGVKGSGPKTSLDEIPPATPGDREDIRKLAAAAGVSVLIKTRTDAPWGNLGEVLETPAGEWWKKGLDRVHGKE